MQAPSDYRMLKMSSKRSSNKKKLMTGSSLNTEALTRTIKKIPIVSNPANDQLKMEAAKTSTSKGFMRIPTRKTQVFFNRVKTEVTYDKLEEVISSSSE